MILIWQLRQLELPPAIVEHVGLRSGEMIELACIKCQAQFQVDEAFAGSACRCKSCGTIQTVPKPRRAEAPAGAGKALYTSRKRAGAPSSGLEALADVVASSGLSSGLPELASAKQETARKRLPLIAAIAGGTLGVIATVVIMLLITRPTPPPTPASADPAAGPVLTSQFCGVPIESPVVIYLLDRGNSTRDAMGHLVNATAASIRSLGSDRKFQVIFWDNGQSVAAYPAGGPQFATPESVSAAQRVMEGVVAHGRTDIAEPLRQALAAGAGDIMLVTAKGAELDESFAQLVIAAQKTAPAQLRIHTFAIGEAGDALPAIAAATAGQHRTLSINDLRDAAK